MATASNVRLVSLLEQVKSRDPENTLLLELYKRHDSYSIDGLLKEIREDGSNTIGRILTGAVDYDEIVKRVAVKVSVKKEDLADDEVQNELLVLQTSLKAYWEKLDSAEQRQKMQELVLEFGANGRDVLNTILLGSNTALLTLLNTSGTYVVEVILFRIFATIFAFQVAFTAARFAALAIPFLNVVMGAWLVFDISGPAYRKIVPSVLSIALLRISNTVKKEDVIKPDQDADSLLRGTPFEENP